MELYKIELYKLIHRKFFLISLSGIFAVLLLYFCFVNIGGERSTVNGVVYTGLQAIKKDREITEAFQGILTDDKAEQIMESYGFPSAVSENYGGFRDENYLNGLITEYLGNGYFYSWDDYQVSTSLLPISQTELGKAAELAGKELLLDYTKGWSVFFDLLQLGMVLGSFLLIIGLSPVFAEEHQTGMSALLFTSKKGKSGDIAAKTAASFTLTALVYAAVVLFAFSATGLVYGLDGLECMNGFVSSPYGVDAASRLAIKPVSYSVFLTLLLDWLALTTLCSIVLCISGHTRTSFHAALLSGMAWILPLLLRILFSGIGYLLASGTPLFLIMTGILYDWYSFLFFPAGIAVCIFTVCIINSWQAYKASEIDR